MRSANSPKAMELYGTQSNSIPQKVLIHLAELLLLWVSWWLLFGGGGAWASNIFGINNAGPAAYQRREVLFFFNIVTFFRFAYMMFFMLRRKIPFEEMLSVPMAFAVYFVGFSFLVLPVSKPIDALDVFAVGLFVFGCVLNTAGEVLRARWKNDTSNSGKLYTGGFFRYSRHINYFGDILWVTAYAIVTRNLYSAIIPALLFCFFAFYNAPKLDEYLRVKYGKDFLAYEDRTKMLIPFIY